ncbi:putative cytochrome c oxidase subunit [Phaeomoniella chlamydospora]|uniref:Cytochrome c oxidase subunit 13, mitochondrial n=1 Tax=Phaeomoniella chlamydospora TaxID=158046 RepID=A0A0G2GB65_PHACM|nr:putative cytochrome c oxidase subunit [Phaeomoniella chlamydospora]
MSFQRLGLRMGQQLTARASPATKAAIRNRMAFVQRRFASGSQPGKLTGPADNAFNREREAVKQHAAETSDLWRRLSIYVVIPTIIIASINAYNLWNEHWEHWEHLPPLEERTEYPYQNIRTRNFWFGDGDKTLFWNDKVNYHNKDKAT